MENQHRTNTSAQFITVPLEHRDILFLKKKYGKDIMDCLKRAMVIPLIVFCLLVSILIATLVLKLLIGEEVSWRELPFYLLVLFSLSMISLTVSIYPSIMDYSHGKKIIESKSKWRVIGVASKFDTAVAIGEYGWSDKTMTLVGQGKTVSFGLPDKYQDHVEKRGRVQVDFVYDRNNRAEELSSQML